MSAALNRAEYDGLRQLADAWRKVIARVSLGGAECPLPITLSVREDMHGVRIAATMRTRDREPPHAIIDVHQMSQVWNLPGHDGQAFDLISRLARDLWRHECDEWLRVDGRLLSDPHEGGK